MNTEARAAGAQRLIDDPLLQEAFASVREAAIQAWTGTSIAGQQEREFAWLTVKVVDRLEAELKNMVIDGRFAAARVQAPIR